jgi:hypothetical protein
MKRSVIAGAVALLIVPLTAISVMTAGASGTSAPCDEGHWPATVQGRPERLHAGSTNGFYVWHDSSGWHLRTTTPTRTAHVFTGRITSTGAIKVVSRVRDENDDRITVSGNTLVFRFVTYAGIDGVDFTIGCTSSVGFALREGGSLIPPSLIFLGHTGRARANPFSVHRI